jgi:hypothetical protein
MVRVIKTERGSRTTLTVDGRLTGDSVGIVENCCIQAESGGKPVKLYLRDVTGVDEAGHTLLTRLAAKGVRLVANGLYTSYVVEALGRLTSAGSRGRNSGRKTRR